MYLYGKIKLILLATILGILFIFMPQIARTGFFLSEYLSDQLRINYAISLTLSVLGFLHTYLKLTKYENLNVNRAINAYLAFAFGMSGIYYLVYISHPGCFSLPSDISEKASIIDFIYFSFVTVTTVGYGDIAPLHTFVRFLVLLQVLFGISIVISISNLKK